MHLWKCECIKASASGKFRWETVPVGLHLRDQFQIRRFTIDRFKFETLDQGLKIRYQACEHDNITLKRVLLSFHDQTASRALLDW